MDHEHLLQQKAPGAPFTCSGCKQLGFGSSYHCQNPNCDYVLDDVCANPEASATHTFFENSYFEFHKKPPGAKERRCDACGKDILGFVYHCSTTEYDLHPCCLKLKNSISDGSVTLKLSNKVRSKCVKCKHKRVVGKVKGWCYYDDRECCYHVSCFKDLIFENWRRGSFSQVERSVATTNSSTSTSSDRDTQVALTSMAISTDQRRRSRTRSKYKKIAIVVFKLIFSAIFGNPISAFVAILEALASN